MKLLNSIHRATFPAVELLIGMGLAQIIATLHIYASNRRLFDQMTAVAAAGFLPVPSPDVAPGLLSPATAVAAALLFTLSLGAGLAFLSAATAGWWTQHAPRAPWVRAAPFGLQAALLLLMNSRGFDLWVSLYAIIIPAPVFLITRRLLSAPAQALPKRFWVWRGLPLLLLALGWATQYDRGLFIDLRDHLLMSNAGGRTVNSFYYRYTLYSAEVFKPLDQRLIRTVAWPQIDPPSAVVRRELIRHDYLPVALEGGADLSLRMQGDRLTFSRNGHILLETPINRFLADPAGVMADVSARADPWPVFRTFTFYGVLLAFPVALYCLLFAGLRGVFGLLGRDSRADLFSALACLLIGLGILAYFHSSRQPPPRSEEIGAAMASEAWQRRVAALREIAHLGLDVGAYPEYAAILRSPHPQERYWLALTLATGANPAASAGLAVLLEDPSLNVRTQAVEAIARRRDRAAAPAILSRLKTSQDWYFQLYAYRALRALGWNQTASR